MSTCEEEIERFNGWKRKFDEEKLLIVVESVELKTRDE